MLCGEAERLFDAYLDGELSGTLRLELEAHRLRCGHCQQTLAMLETCGHVIATDRSGPMLGDGFADRVMAEISERRQGRMRVLRLRAVRIAGGLSAAAAVLLLAFGLYGGAPRGERAGPLTPVAAADAGVDLRDVLYRDVTDRLARAVTELMRQGTQDTRRLSLLALYLDVSDETAQAFADPAGLSPLRAFGRLIGVPTATEAPEPRSDQFAL